jgi:hypothetical protein
MSAFGSGLIAFSGPDNPRGNLVFLEKEKCMIREWLSVIPRGARVVITATTAMLAFMLLWRAVAIIVSDAVSYASRH